MQKIGVNTFSQGVDNPQSNAGRVTLSLKVTRGSKLNPFKVGFRRSLKAVVIGHTSQEEAGLYDLGVSANPTPYRQKEKRGLTLIVAGCQRSLIFS